MINEVAERILSTSQGEGELIEKYKDVILGEERNVAISILIALLAIEPERMSDFVQDNCTAMLLPPEKDNLHVLVYLLQLLTSHSAINQLCDALDKELNCDAQELLRAKAFISYVPIKIRKQIVGSDVIIDEPRINRAIQEINELAQGGFLGFDLNQLILLPEPVKQRLDSSLQCVIRMQEKKVASSE